MLILNKKINHNCKDINGYSWELTQEHNRASLFKAEIYAESNIKKSFMAHTPRNRIIDWVTEETAQLKLKALLQPKNPNKPKGFEDWQDLIKLSRAMGNMNVHGRVTYRGFDQFCDHEPIDYFTRPNIPEANQAAAHAGRTGKHKSKTKYGSPYGC